MANLDNNFNINQEYIKSNPGYAEQDSLVQLATQKQEEDFQASPFKKYLKGPTPKKEVQDRLNQAREAFLKQQTFTDIINNISAKPAEEDKYVQAIQKFIGDKYYTPDQDRNDAIGSYLAVANAYAEQSDLLDDNMNLQFYKYLNPKANRLAAAEYGGGTEEQQAQYKIFEQQELINSLWGNIRDLQEKRKKEQEDPDALPSEEIPDISMYIDRKDKANRVYNSIYNFDSISPYILNEDQMEVYKQFDNLEPEEQLKYKQSYINYVANSSRTSQNVTFQNSSDKKINTEVQAVDNWIHDNIANGTTGKIGSTVITALAALPAIPAYIRHKWITDDDTSYFQFTRKESKGAWDILWGTVGGIASETTKLFSKGDNQDVQSFNKALDESIERHGQVFQDMQKSRFKDLPEWQEITKDGASKAKQLLSQISGAYVHRNDYNIDLNDQQLQDLWDDFAMQAALVGEDNAMQMLARGAEKQLYNNFQNSGYLNRIQVGGGKALRTFVADIISTGVSMGAVVANPTVFAGNPDMIKESTWLKYASDVMQSGYITKEGIEQWEKQDPLLKWSATQNLVDPDRAMDFWSENPLETTFSVMGQYGFTVGTTILSFGTSAVAKTVSNLLTKGLMKKELRKQLLKEITKKGIKKTWLQRNFGNLSKGLDDNIVKAAQRKVIMDRKLVGVRHAIHKRAQMFGAGFLGTAEGGLEARSTYDEALTELHSMNDQLYDTQHEQELNIIRKQADAFYMENADIVENEIRSNPEIYGAVEMDSLIPGVHTQQDVQNAQINYAHQYERAKNALIQEAIQEYKLSDDEYLEAYEKADATALTAGYINFWFNSAINGMMFNTLKSRQLSQGMRQALADKRKLLKKSIKFVKDPEKAVLNMRAELAEQPLWKRMAHNLWEIGKESFGEGLEEYEQGLSNAFSQGFAQSAYTVYLVNNYNPNTTKYMAQKLLAPIFGTYEDISLLYYATSGGTKNALNMATSVQTLKEGMFGFLSTLIGGFNISSKIGPNSWKTFKRQIRHPWQSFKMGLSTFGKDVKELNFAKAIFEDVPLFNNGFIVWRSAITNAYMQAQEDKEIVNDAISKINTTLSDPNKSKLWNLLSGQSQITEAFNKALEEGDELDLNDSNLQSLIQTALILQASRDSDVGRAYIENLERLANLDDKQLGLIFDEKGNFRGEDNLATKEAKDLWDIIKEDIALYDNQYEGNQDSAKSKIDLISRNAAEQLRFLERVNRIGSQYEKMFGSDITEDTKAAFIMGDMLADSYEEQLESLNNTFEEFRMSLGNTEVSSTSNILKQLVAKYGQNVEQGLSHQIDLYQGMLDFLNTEIEHAQNVLQKKELQQQKKLLEKTLRRTKVDAEAYNRIVNKQYDNEQQKSGQKGILEENQNAGESSSVVTDTAQQIMGEEAEETDEDIVLTEGDILELSSEFREKILTDDASKKAVYTSEQLAIVDALKKKWQDFLKQKQEDDQPVESYYDAVRRHNRLTHSLDEMAHEREEVLSNIGAVNAFGEMLKRKEQLNVVIQSMEPLFDTNNYDRWDDQEDAINNRAKEIFDDPKYLSIRQQVANYVKKRKQHFTGLAVWLKNMNGIGSKIANASGNVKENFENYVRAVGILYAIISDKQYDNKRNDIINRLANGGSLEIIKDILSNPEEYIQCFNHPYMNLPAVIDEEKKKIDEEKTKKENEELQKVLEEDKKGIQDIDSVAEDVSNIIQNILTSTKKQEKQESKETNTKAPKITQPSTGKQSVPSAAEEAEKNPPIVDQEEKQQQKTEPEPITSTLNVMQPKQVIEQCGGDTGLYDALCALGWEDFLGSFKGRDYTPENSYRLIRARIGGYDLILACAKAPSRAQKGISVDGITYGILGVVKMSKADDSAVIEPTIIKDQNSEKPLFFSTTINTGNEFHQIDTQDNEQHTSGLLEWINKMGIKFADLIKRLYVENEDVRLREGANRYRGLRVITDFKQLTVRVNEAVMSIGDFFKKLGEDSTITADNKMIQSWKECIQECIREGASTVFEKLAYKEQIFSLSDFLDIILNANNTVANHPYVNSNIRRGNAVKDDAIKVNLSLDAETFAVSLKVYNEDKEGEEGKWAVFEADSIEKVAFQLMGYLCDKGHISLNIPSNVIKSSLTALQNPKEGDKPAVTVDEAENKAVVLPALLKMGALKMNKITIGGFKSVQITVRGQIDGQTNTEQETPKPPVQLPQTPAESIEDIENAKQNKMRKFIDSLVSQVLSKTRLTSDVEHYQAGNDGSHLFNRVTKLLHRIVGGVVQKYNSDNPYNNKATSLGNTVDGITRVFFSVVSKYREALSKEDTQNQAFLDLCAEVYMGYTHQTGYLDDSIQDIKFTQIKDKDKVIKDDYAPRHFNGQNWETYEVPNLSHYGFITLVTHLLQIQKMCESKNWHIIPNDVTVKGIVKSISDSEHGEPVAGTLDLLVIDEKGKLKIIDIKTMHFDTGEDVKQSKDPKISEHINKWSAQVTLYKNLLEQEVRAYVERYNASASADDRITADDLDDLWSENPLCIFPMGVRYERDLELKRGNKHLKQVTRTVDGQAYTIEVQADMTEKQIDELPDTDFLKGVKMRSSVAPLVIEDEQAEIEKEGNYRIVDGYIIGVSEYNNGDIVIQPEQQATTQSAPDENVGYKSNIDETAQAGSGGSATGNGTGESLNLDSSKQTWLSRRISKKRKFQVRRSIKPGKKISKAQFVTQQINRILGELLSPWSSQDLVDMAGLSLNTIIRSPREAASRIVEYMKKYYAYKMQTTRDTIQNLEYMCNRDRLLYQFYTGSKSYADVYRQLQDKGDDVSEMTILREYEEANAEQREKMKQDFLAKYKDEQSIIDDYNKQIQSMQAIQQEYNERQELMQSGMAQAVIFTAIENTVRAADEAIQKYGLNEFDSNMILYEVTSKKVNSSIKSFMEESHIDTTQSQDISGFIALLESKRHASWDNAQKYILSQLADILKDANIPIRFIQDQDDSKLGRTVIEGNEVKEVIINLANMDNIDILAATLVHEAVHVCTEFMIKEDTGIKEDIQQMIDYIKRYIEVGGANPQNVYGLRSPSEFVAEFFANPLFQNMLKNIPYIDNRNAFQKFIDFIMSLFKGTHASVYDKIDSYMHSMLSMSSLLAYSGTKVKDRQKFVAQVKHFKAIRNLRTVKFDTLSKSVQQRLRKYYNLTAGTFEALPKDMQDKLIDCCDWI